jgi:putative colanic acid biosynthesis acetyltransferase WcaF
VRDVTGSSGSRLRVSPSPSLGLKLRRGLWGAAWFLLYRPTPVPLHGWRRFLLRLFGARVGAGAHPYPSAWVWAPWNLELGPGSCLAAGVDCYSAGRVVIGAGCVISQRAYLCSASHDIHDPSFPLLLGDIHVEDGAWVATEAFVGPGVTVGRFAVLGARAVTTRDVEARAVMVGNPARCVGRRAGFDETKYLCCGGHDA